MGVMRMPFFCAAIALSISVIWPSSSPSALPEPTLMSAPSAGQFFLALCCMATKNGFVESLVIRDTPMLPPAAAPPDEVEAPEELLLLPPQAARASEAASPAPRRRLRGAGTPGRVEVERGMGAPSRGVCTGWALTTLSGQL